VLKDIKDYYGTLELADPKLAATPEDNSEAIEQLVISHGYSCNACRYLTISDVIGLDWSWIRASIQSSPDVGTGSLQVIQNRSSSHFYPFGTVNEPLNKQTWSGTVLVLGL
jgi:hypothetical protein